MGFSRQEYWSGVATASIAVQNMYLYRKELDENTGTRDRTQAPWIGSSES